MRASTYDLVLIDAKNGSLLLDSLLSWRHCNAAACTPAIVLTPFPDWTAMLGWITRAPRTWRIASIWNRCVCAHVVLQRENHRAGADTVTLGGYVLRRDLGVLTLNGVEIRSRRANSRWRGCSFRIQASS